MESISIEITERCPAGLEILRNQTDFSVNLTPKGGVGDFEILNSNQEVVIIGQKHLSTISLLENTSRSEVLTLDLSNLSDISISCPPTDEIASIRNARMGLCAPNTLEIQPQDSSRSNALTFRWKPATKNSETTTTSPQTEDKKTKDKGMHNFEVMNSGSVVVAEIFLSRLSSKVTVHFPTDVSLSPVQIALIFSGLAFQIYGIRKQKSVFGLSGIGIILALVLFLIILYLALS